MALDLSGYVCTDSPSGGVTTQWDDLTPLTQRFVTAFMRRAGLTAFSALPPATLAEIMATTQDDTP